MTIKKENSPKVFILDVDGVMTTGHFIYSAEGKVMKIFGPDDYDALTLLQTHIEIRFITGDKTGFEISKRRIVDDMHFSLDLVSSIHRLDWIRNHYHLQQVIYMVDGIFDHYVMRQVAYSVAPSNADLSAKQCASHVTERAGGNRAVAEACVHLMEKFFTPLDATILLKTDGRSIGDWTG